MKRKSRSKGSGSDNKNPKNRDAKNAARGGGGRGGPNDRSSDDRGPRSAAAPGDRESGERDEKGGRGGRGEKRVIKNARGLRDVLGLGNKTGGGRPGNFTPRPVRGGSIDEAASAAKPAVSKKLTYITNFQPPGPIKEDPKVNEATRAKFNSKSIQRAAAEDAESAPEKSKQSERPGSRAPIRPGSRSETADAPPSKNLRGGKSREDQEIVRTPAPSKSESKKERGQNRNSSKEQRRGRKEEEPAPERKNIPGSRNTPDVLTGTVKRHPDGFGFLLPDDREHPDVYISRQSMTGVMTNDRVEVNIYKPRHKGGERDDRLAGEISRVLSHATTRVVGQYLPVDQKYGVIQDGDHGWGADLRIAAKDTLNAKEGDLVAVEITQYPGANTAFTGKVVALIGNMDDPMNDIIRVIHTAGIHSEFPKDVQNEARKFGEEVTDDEIRGREDLTMTPLITVDGATAKDFDDAIWAEQTETGFRAIVAIADVSHYVKPGTKLDAEAYERGTSTYFPNFVVPMLPEELSNELCSLKPDVTRLCFACEMYFDFSGVVQKFRFFEAVMESKARVIYGEAQEVLDGRPPQRFSADVRNNIKVCADLAKILMQKRFREGSLELEIPETQIVVDKSGATTDIIRSERLFAHRMIEELMLVTNICTARFMDENEMPGIYRIHEEPDPDNIKALQRYLWNLGGSKSVTGPGLQKKLTKALQSMEGRPESQILNILTLRTMRQAQYSEANVGHFGLGFAHYSHFTSPIRRYPDLIAHRLIKSQIYPRYRGTAMTEDDLQSATTFLSGCEQRSVKAERKVISIKKARFIRQFVGQEFEGVISSVAKFGVFVLLRKYDVDGLVKIENLGPDRFMFDEENLRLIGPRTGIRYTIGDVLKVRVMGADPEQGKVDFELAEPPVASPDDEDEDFAEGGSGFGDDRESRTPRRDGAGRPARQDGKRKGQNASKKGKRVNAQERGTPANDSRGVRQERVSKRRGKN